MCTVTLISDDFFLCSFLVLVSKNVGGSVRANQQGSEVAGRTVSRGLGSLINM